MRAADLEEGLIIDEQIYVAMQRISSLPIYEQVYARSPKVGGVSSCGAQRKPACAWGKNLLITEDEGGGMFT